MMEYKGYIGKVEIDEGAGVLYGEEPEKPLLGKFVVRLPVELHRKAYIQARFRALSSR